MRDTCGDNENAGIDTTETTGTAANPTDGGFCEAIAHLIVLLSPTDDSSPTETEATFTEAAGWFEQANSAAPAAIVQYPIDECGLSFGDEQQPPPTTT